eukprot:scaffold45520_cov64-Phaeocystis_antarctica.AAC.10
MYILRTQSIKTLFSLISSCETRSAVPGNEKDWRRSPLSSYALCAPEYLRGSRSGVLLYSSVGMAGMAAADSGVGGSGGGRRTVRL